MTFEEELLEAVAEREQRRRTYGDAADLAEELEREIERSRKNS